METMTTNIHNLLEETPCQFEYNRWLLILKMNTYIACTLTEAFENKFNKPSTDIALMGRKGEKDLKLMN
ncbi:hypothetical protein Anas_08860 [Armadillidium nasatum]|uniref:Uncharacterized protein n=1 Tax=Armadillidium nasatum TaxID=96803 RepID=A0A5N5STC6_9CRUS|nr:hypothetical protein Anas_08860 [Armadillidium nasatum]